MFGAIASLAGSLMTKRSADKQSNFLKYQYEDQKQYQDNRIQRTVEDAKKAGIHPLAAIGGGFQAGSPQMVGTAPVPDYSDGLGRMGQNIDRALMAQTTDHQKKMMDLQLDSARLDNDIKRAELASRRRTVKQQLGPSMPDMVDTKPAEVTSHASGKREQEAGTKTSVAWLRNSDGSLSPAPSRDTKDLTEDNFLLELPWAARNYIGPTWDVITGNQESLNQRKPSKKELPKGAVDWDWVWWKGAYDPVYPKDIAGRKYKNLHKKSTIQQMKDKKRPNFPYRR